MVTVQSFAEMLEEAKHALLRGDLAFVVEVLRRLSWDFAHGRRCAHLVRMCGCVRAC